MSELLLDPCGSLGLCPDAGHLDLALFALFLHGSLIFELHVQHLLLELQPGLLALSRQSTFRGQLLLLDFAQILELLLLRT